MAEHQPPTLDVLIVGAGFAGLYLMHRMRGAGLSAHVHEGADGVGGTWYWNRYPGARFDSESYTYGYSFSRELLDEWHWRERFSGQPENLRYLNHVADRFDLRRDVQLNTRIVSALFDRKTGLWMLRTDKGDTSLLLIDLGLGQNRLGASCLAQVYKQLGQTPVDLDSQQLLFFFH